MVSNTETHGDTNTETERERESDRERQRDGERESDGSRKVLDTWLRVKISLGTTSRVYIHTMPQVVSPTPTSLVRSGQPRHSSQLRVLPCGLVNLLPGKAS